MQVAEWSPEEAARLAEEAVGALANVRGKKARHSLDAVVALFDNPPGSVLEAGGLVETLARLKKLKKLPKADKMEQIFKLLQDIGERRCAMALSEKQGTEPETAQAEKPEEKTSAPE